MEVDEAQLVRQVSGGDEQAFRLLLARHLPAVSAYARRMLNDVHEADDIAQEVFTRLWTDADRYRPEAAKLTTWLHRIAHNLCIDWMRKSGRVSLGEVPDEGGAVDAPPEVLARRELGGRVRDAVGALPERQRSALVLCQYQGLSNIDAAAVLEVSVDALESLLSRARRTLRAELEADHES